MRRGATLLAAGLIALIVQGSLATFLPPPWCPDLALLVLLALGLHWEGMTGGFVLAALLGYATDLLSGSLFGQHALLNLLAFAATSLATRQLDVRGFVPLILFAVALTLVYGLAMLVVTGFFVGGVELRLGWFGAQLIHAGVGGACAPFVAAGIGRLVLLSGEDEAGYRLLGLEPRGPAVR